MCSRRNAQRSASLAVAIAQSQIDHASSTALSLVLYAAALLAGVAVVPTLGRASISASFIVIALAAAFLGPTSAAVCALLAEVTAAITLRTRPQGIAINLFASVVPALLAGNLVHALAPNPYPVLTM